MKRFISFLLCLAVAALLAYEISGIGGLFIITLLLTALVLSLTQLIVTVKTLSARLELSSNIVSKGDSFAAGIRFEKSTLLPTCLVEVKISITPNIAAEDGLEFKTVCVRRSGEAADVRLKAELSGCAEVRIEKIIATDYLGIFSKKLTADNDVSEIKIIPHIPDTGTQTDILRSTAENTSFDDSDEESDETAIGLTGVPGYEHRQYVSGDPLKRVNWKLSSKRDQLMVRLDEKVSSSSRVFLLDYPVRDKRERIYYENADMITEAALAMLSMLIRSGFESEFNYYMDGWEMVCVKDEGSLLYLQERLAGLKPYPDENRMPDHNINTKGRAQICFSACMDDMPRSLSALTDGFSGALVVTELSGIGKVKSEMWRVNDEFEFTKMQ